MNPPTPWSQLEVVDVGDAMHVDFKSQKTLDEQTLQMLSNELFRLIEDRQRREIHLSFSSVEYLSSAALGKLISLNRKIQAMKGKLVLCGLSKEIREVFEITKLDKVFTIKHDTDAGK